MHASSLVCNCIAIDVVAMGVVPARLVPRYNYPSLEFYRGGETQAFGIVRDDEPPMMSGVCGGVQSTAGTRFLGRYDTAAVLGPNRQHCASSPAARAADDLIHTGDTHDPGLPAARSRQATMGMAISRSLHGPIFDVVRIRPFPAVAIHEYETVWQPGRHLHALRRYGTSTGNRGLEQTHATSDSQLFATRTRIRLPARDFSARLRAARLRRLRGVGSSARASRRVAAVSAPPLGQVGGEPRSTSLALPSCSPNVRSMSSIRQIEDPMEH